MDKENQLVYSSYQRHGSEPFAALKAMLEELPDNIGDKQFTATVTGSGGIGVSERLGIPFVQEVIAGSRAVEQFIPDEIGRASCRERV